MDQLRYLIQLQALENKKKALIAERNEIPRKKARLEKAFQEFENECLMRKTELDHLRKLHRDLEKHIASLDDRLRKARQKEGEVKTNKEYKALLKEQEDIKREIAEKEDQVLDCMEKIELLQQEVVSRTKEMEERRKMLERDREALTREDAEITEKINHLMTVQEMVKEKLDEQLLKRCEFLMVKQGGIAVAAVDKGVCRVCHVSLPPQKFIELQKNEGVMSCPHCHRFIYWPQNEEYLRAEEEILAAF